MLGRHRMSANKKSQEGLPDGDIHIVSTPLFPLFKVKYSRWPSNFCKQASPVKLSEKHGGPWEDYLNSIKCVTSGRACGQLQ